MAICPRRGVRTLRETRLAVGRLRERTGYAPDQPTTYKINTVYLALELVDLLKMAMGKMRRRSMKRN